MNKEQLTIEKLIIEAKDFCIHVQRTFLGEFLKCFLFWLDGSGGKITSML
jgi:hypothetical protein